MFKYNMIGEQTKIALHDYTTHHVAWLYYAARRIRSEVFCANYFYLVMALTKATKDSQKILEGSEDVQSIVQV